MKGVAGPDTARISNKPPETTKKQKIISPKVSKEAWTFIDFEYVTSRTMC